MIAKTNKKGYIARPTIKDFIPVKEIRFKIYQFTVNTTLLCFFCGIRTSKVFEMILPFTHSINVPVSPPYFCEKCFKKLK